MHIPGNKVLFWFTITGFIILVLGLLFGFIFFPLIIDDQIYRNVRLKAGTEQFERFEELPLDVNYRVYVFHVTNPDDVTYNGAKPQVEERGPYVYKQSRRKQDITYDEEADTLTYVQNMHFEFDVEESFPNTEDDNITMLNILQNTFFQVGYKYLHPILYEVVDYYWPLLFPDTNSLFHTVRVGNLLLDGHTFCEPENLGQVAKLLCVVLGRMDIDFVETQSDGSLKFSLLKYKQDQHDGVYTVNAGIKNVKKLGMISEWNGYTYLDVWNERMSTCNKVTGGDSTIYPPSITVNDEFSIFATEICRAAYIYYEGEDEVQDIKGQKRILREDTFSVTTPCFCMDGALDLYGEEKCLPYGFFDLEACYGVPIIASFPHFLYGDEEYSNTVIGLSPQKEDHETYVILEPRTGIPLTGYKRIQFNLMVRPVEGIKVTEGATHSMIPILWAEEGVTITDEYVDMIQDRFFSILTTIEIVKWVIIGIGIAMFVGFGCVYVFVLKFKK